MDEQADTIDIVSQIALMNYRAGIWIIPSDEIRNGYKRTVGDNIYVSSQNYAYLKDMSAKGVLVMLAILKEKEDNG